MGGDKTMGEINKIAIAGAGGIGGFVCALLYDYGCIRAQFSFPSIKIDVFDSDTIDDTNLLHQNFDYSQLGENKAKIMSEKYHLTSAVQRFMTRDDFENYDVIFSCVDTMSFRKDLYTYGFDHPELFWIDGRCSSRNIGCYTSTIPKVELEKLFNSSDVKRGCLLAIDKENKVSHVTPLIVAGMMVQMFLNHIRGEDNTSPLNLYI